MKISIELPYFNFDKAFEKAAEKAKDAYEADQDYDVNVYDFKLVHIKTTYRYYKFGEENYYIFEFEANK